MIYNHTIKSIPGVNVRARFSNKENRDYEPFKNPIIHKQVNGKEIVPLSITKLWG